MGMSPLQTVMMYNALRAIKTLTALSGSAGESITAIEEAITTIEAILEEETVPVVVVEDKVLIPGEKKIRVKTPTGDVTITLPTAVDREHDTISITKVDDSSNDVIVEDDGENVLATLTYQYQTVILVSDNTDWNILQEASSNYANIVVGTTAPTDTSLLWVDTNE